MKKILAFFGVSAVAIAGALSFAPPASAYTNPPGCDGSSFLCIYQFHAYEGSRLFTSQSNTNWDYLGNPAAFRNMNDKMSSVANTTGRTYGHVFQHDGYEGYDYCVPPGVERSNVSNYIENKSSSHNFASGC